jgi:hypothetical protein
MILYRYKMKFQEISHVDFFITQHGNSVFFVFGLVLGQKLKMAFFQMERPQIQRAKLLALMMC